MAKIINKHIKETKATSILDAGCGEGQILARLNRDKMPVVFAIDISQKRLNMARENCLSATLWKCGMENITLLDNSVDLVYTVHAIEPNSSFAVTRIIRELYRITRKRLVLIEPDYEGGNQATKDNIDKHQYVKGIAAKLKHLEIPFKYTFLAIGKSDNQNAMYVIDK